MTLELIARWGIMPRTMEDSMARKKKGGGGRKC